jgi:hypothetical protein
LWLLKRPKALVTTPLQARIFAPPSPVDHILLVGHLLLLLLELLLLVEALDLGLVSLLFHFAFQGRVEVVLDVVVGPAY